MNLLNRIFGKPCGRCGKKTYKSYEGIGWFCKGCSDWFKAREEMDRYARSRGYDDWADIKKAAKSLGIYEMMLAEFLKRQRLWK